MTSLAIIGGGIAGKSILYALTRGSHAYDKVHLFQSDTFSRACSLRSTAVVAPRGLSYGHSDLGDLILNGFSTFSQHVEKDSPLGVRNTFQYTSASEKLDEFKRRYPQGEMKSSLPGFSFSTPVYTATDKAYVIDPDVYLTWLLSQSEKCLDVEVINDFVTEVNGDNQLKTFSGKIFQFDKIIIAGGIGNHYFRQKGKPIQGSYLEFLAPDFGEAPFSLTLNGDNVVYHPGKKLLIGSTSQETYHEIIPEKALADIYHRLQNAIDRPFPKLSDGKRVVGMRDKAPKRMPYVTVNGSKNQVFFGGLYKNGYTLGLHLGTRALEMIDERPST